MLLPFVSPKPQYRKRTDGLVSVNQQVTIAAHAVLSIKGGPYRPYQRFPRTPHHHHNQIADYGDNIGISDRKLPSWNFGSSRAQ